MPIKAISGVPGAGKTLLALEMCLTELGIKDQSSPEAIQRQLPEAKRPFAVCGVEGLRIELCLAMWAEVPVHGRRHSEG